MTVTVAVGDCLDVLRTLDAESVQCCVTSPPYFGLRDYGHAGQIGLEPTPDAYVAKMVASYDELRKQRDYWERIAKDRTGDWQRAERSIRSLRGVITKLTRAVSERSR